MIILSCVDDKFGLTFNERRQSRDRVVTERIYEITKKNRLFVSPFSEKLFEGKGIIVSDNLFDEAKTGDFVFIENIEIKDFSSVEKIILFFWNTVYPSDFKFSLPEYFREIKRRDFQGFSHKKITEVEYEKKKA